VRLLMLLCSPLLPPAPPFRAGLLQGDTDASKFYVMERGSADVLLFKEEWGEQRTVHSYAPGSSFGELALLYSAPRAATVKATAEGKLWVSWAGAVLSACCMLLRSLLPTDWRAGRRRKNREAGLVGMCVVCHTPGLPFLLAP
jgi:hypothetical protein